MVYQLFMLAIIFANKLLEFEDVFSISNLYINRIINSSSKLNSILYNISCLEMWVIGDLGYVLVV